MQSLPIPIGSLAERRGKNNFAVVLANRPGERDGDLEFTEGALPTCLRCFWQQSPIDLRSMGWSIWRPEPTLLPAC